MDKIINLNKYKEQSDKEEIRKAIFQKGIEIEKIITDVGKGLCKFSERMIFLGLAQTLSIISQAYDLTAYDQVKVNIVDDEVVTGEFEENLIRMVDLNIELAKLKLKLENIE